MANKSLEEVLNISAASGPFGTGDAVIQQVMRDFIQLESLRLSIGTDLVGVRSVPWLEFKWYTAGVGSFSYPIDDAAVVDATKIGTKNYTVKLEKGQGRTTFLDTVKLRGESFENMDSSNWLSQRVVQMLLTHTFLTNYWLEQDKHLLQQVVDSRPQLEMLSRTF